MARREETGHKPGLSALHQTIERGVASELPITGTTTRMALTIPEFCGAFGISQAFFFKLRKQGQGPREMKVGARTLISIEAAAEWCRQCEEATEASARST